MTGWTSLLLACVASMAGTMALNRHASQTCRYAPAEVAEQADGLSCHFLGDVTACALALLLFGLTCGLSGRPILAGLLTVGFVAVLWATNIVKVRTLHEPLLITDVALLGLVIRWPHLYFPFFPRSWLWGGGILVVGGFFLCRRLEPALTDGPRLASAGLFLLGVLMALTLGNIRRLPILANRLLSGHPLAFDVDRDGRTYSLMGAALLHLVWYLTRRAKVTETGTEPGIPPYQPDKGNSGIPPALTWTPSVLTPVCPHIFLIQAESFFDPRGLLPALPEHLLAEYDRVTGEGQGGKLRVNAFGAYTMRTEFSVLTGLGREALGVDGFDPYLEAARRPTWSLAWHLRHQGYETVCLHPYHKAFFNRAKAIPNLGFERFLGLEDFADAERFGPYVSDAAVADRLLLLAQTATKPLFCFAITMEAHGPWLPGRLSAAQVAQTLTPPRLETQNKTPRRTENAEGTPDARASETDTIPSARAMYGAHIAHTDAMIGRLRQGLTALDHPAAFALYGDHAGSLPALMNALEYQNKTPDTPYLVWGNAHSRLATPTPGLVPANPLLPANPIPPETLGGLLLQHAATLRR